MPQENIRQDVNGSTDKPFPQERNFVMNPDAYTDQVGQGHTNTELGHEPAKQYGGQVKYARREGAPSIYKDASRYTADDIAASKKAEGSTVFEVEGEGRDTEK